MAYTKKVYKEYGPRKGRNGKVKIALKKKTVSKEKVKSRRNPSITEVLRELPKNERGKTYRAHIRGKVTEVGTAAASTASTGISVGSGIKGQALDLSRLSNSDLSQNVTGGLSKAGNNRDEDEEYSDFGGVI